MIELEKRYWSLKNSSRSGKLDLETLTPLLHPVLPRSVCHGLFSAFDENQDNHIDFKEMACGVSAACRGPAVERQKCKTNESRCGTNIDANNSVQSASRFSTRIKTAI